MELHTLSCDALSQYPFMIFVLLYNTTRTCQPSIRERMSRQFLSSLLLAAPPADGVVTIAIKDELSYLASYFALTVGLMNNLGVAVDSEGTIDTSSTSLFMSTDQCYKSSHSGQSCWREMPTSASYFKTGAAMTGGTITVRGCASESLGGDVAFANVMELRGATVPRSRCKVLRCTTATCGVEKREPLELNDLSNVREFKAGCRFRLEGFAIQRTQHILD